MPGAAPSTESEALCINTSGQMAGYAQYFYGGEGDGGTGVLWSPSGADTLLQGLPGGSTPVAINASGETVGYSYGLGGGSSEAVLWSASGQATVLQDPGGLFAINKFGDSCGGFATSTGEDAVYWNSGGAATVLTSLGGDSNAFSLNNCGDIGGISDNEAALWSDTGSIIWHGDSGSGINVINAKGDAVGTEGNSAAFWSPTGAETFLANPGGGQSAAVAINASGQSVGYSDTSNGVDAVLWSPTGTATVLHDLRGATTAYATDINACGASVGYSLVDDKQVATHWSADGKATNLHTILGSAWADTVATGINNAGDICGYGQDSESGLGLTPFELLWSKSAGTADAGHYVVEAAGHQILAASAVHA